MFAWVGVKIGVNDQAYASEPLGIKNLRSNKAPVA
jgi:hypothetical protein